MNHNTYTHVPVVQHIYQSMTNTLDSIFQYGPSKLLIIRLDYGIRDGHQSSTHFFEFRDWFKQLKDNMRHNAIFSHHIGMCWSFEYTHDKSYHCHALHIFDGQAVQDGGHHSDQLGEYWSKITQGKGHYWPCNQHANYPVNGIGMIRHNDWPKRQALMTHVVSYLAKPDLLIRAAIQQDANALGMPHWAHKVRTYGASHPLTGRQSAAGRPRVGVMASVQYFDNTTGGIQPAWSASVPPATGQLGEVRF